MCVSHAALSTAQQVQPSTARTPQRGGQVPQGAGEVSQHQHPRRHQQGHHARRQQQQVRQGAGGLQGGRGAGAQGSTCSEHLVLLLQQQPGRPLHQAQQFEPACVMVRVMMDRRRCAVSDHMRRTTSSISTRPASRGWAEAGRGAVGAHRHQAVQGQALRWHPAGLAPPPCSWPAELGSAAGGGLALHRAGQGVQGADGIDVGQHSSKLVKACAGGEGGGREGRLSACCNHNRRALLGSGAAAGSPGSSTAEGSPGSSDKEARLGPPPAASSAPARPAPWLLPPRQPARGRRKPPARLRLRTSRARRAWSAACGPWRGWQRRTCHKGGQQQRIYSDGLAAAMHRYPASPALSAQARSNSWSSQLTAHSQRGCQSAAPPPAPRSPAPAPAASAP